MSFNETAEKEAQERVLKLHNEIVDETRNYKSLLAQHSVINAVSSSDLAADISPMSSANATLMSRILKKGRWNAYRSGLNKEHVDYDYVYDLSEIIADCDLPFPAQLEYSVNCNNKTLAVETKSTDVENSWELQLADDIAAKESSYSIHQKIL